MEEKMRERGEESSKLSIGIKAVNEVLCEDMNDFT
jgi:hypothetical protein